MLGGEGHTGGGGDVSVLDVEGRGGGLVGNSCYSFSFVDLSLNLWKSMVGLPVDILADVVNLDIWETVGFDSCLSDVLQVRVIVKERICSNSRIYLRLRAIAYPSFMRRLLVSRPYSNASSAESLRRHRCVET